VKDPADRSGPPPGARPPHDVIALLLLGGLIAWIIASGWPAARYASEPFYRSQLARDLLAGLSRGRQGLVGSLAFAPLPSVAVTLLSALPGVGERALAGPLLAGLSALALCLYANRLWAAQGIGPWVRWPALGAGLALPPVALSLESGQSTMLFVALAVCGWGFLCTWLREPRLRDLAYCGLLLGMCALVRYQALCLVALGAVFALAGALAQRRRGLAEATLIVFLTPALYLLALWVGGNWLILGEPAFFLRGLLGMLREGGGRAWALLGSGCEWRAAGALGALVLSVPLAGCLSRRRRGGALRHAAALAGLLAAAHVGLGAGAAVRPLEPRIPPLVAALSERCPNGTFVVSGFEGYEFVRAAGRRGRDAWVHLMHLEGSALRKVLRDYAGREVYVLVRARPGTERWEELGLGGGRVPEGFIYAGQLGPWRLFECIRPDEPPLPGRG